MTYEICDYSRIYKGMPNRIDPRVAIARHIGWINTHNYGYPVPWRVPEPVNYNYAVRSGRPIECKFIQDQVFYRTETDSRWWTVYYVPEDSLAAFDSWVKQQPIDYLWFHTRPPAIRTNQRLLYNKKAAEINVNERLFQMGYYAKLGSKYFVDDDHALLSIMGPVRDRVLNGPVDEQTDLLDQAES